MLKKMGFSRDADYRSRWVVPALQLLLTFLTPLLWEKWGEGRSRVLNQCSKILQISHIHTSRSVLNWHRMARMPQNTIKTVHRLWIYLLNLHHLAYSVVFTSIYHIFFNMCEVRTMADYTDFLLSLNTKWLHKLCEGRIKPEGSGRGCSFTSWFKPPELKPARAVKNV